jgi:HlyD family secretion protein
MTRILILSVMLTGCQGKVGPKPDGAPAAASAVAPVVVTTGNPVRKSVKSRIEQPGVIQAFESTPLVARVSGYVKSVNVEIDDAITGPRGDTPGSILLEMNVPEMVEEAKQKSALVRQALSEVELARKTQDAVDAALNSAKALVEEAVARERGAKGNFERWKSEAGRVDDLVSRKVVDLQTGEETRNQLVAAEGAWDEAKAHANSVRAMLKESEAKLARATAEVAAMQSRVAAAEAEARRVEAMVGYATIRAPYDGIVTGRFVHTGHLLQPSNGRSEPVLSVARIDKVRVVVDLPEGIAGRLSKGMKVKVRVPNLRNVEIDGEITRTSWALNPDVHTLKAEIDLPNPDRKLRPGMYAQVAIPMESSDAFVVPTSAITYLDDTAFCFLMVDGKAVKHFVQTGTTDGDSIEVIRKKKVNGKDWLPVDGREPMIVTHQGPLTDGGPVEGKR